MSSDEDIGASHSQPEQESEESQKLEETQSQCVVSNPFPITTDESDTKHSAPLRNVPTTSISCKQYVAVYGNCIDKDGKVNIITSTEPPVPVPRPPSNSQGTVCNFSVKFANTISQIQKKMETCEQFLNIASYISGPNPEDCIFPEAAEAESVKGFFQLACRKKWWHWLDYQRLQLLLTAIQCPEAQNILDSYSNDLYAHICERLGAVDKEIAPATENEVILEMKCKCDPENLSLQFVMQHKAFLKKCLNIPFESFSFIQQCSGCTLTRWRIHSPIQAEVAKKNLQQLGRPLEEQVEEGGFIIYSTRVSLDIKCVMKPVEMQTYPVECLAKLCVPNICKEDFKALMKNAVKKNDKKLLKKLLTGWPSHLSPSHKDEDYTVVEEGVEFTMVALAAKEDFCECLELLLKHGFHPAIATSAGPLPLHFACAKQCIKCVQELTASNLGLTGLQWAKEFLEGCKDLTSDTALAVSKAFKRRQKEIVRPALSEMTETGIFVADKFEKGDLLNSKENSGRTPMLTAVHNDHVSVIKGLQEQGVELIQRNQLTGETTLHIAAASTAPDTSILEVVISEMMNKKPNIGEGGEPSSPLERALWDINCKDRKNQTALEIAAKRRNLPFVKLLLAKGAHTCVPDSKGQLLSNLQYEVNHYIEEARKSQIKKLVCALKFKKSLKEFRMVWQDPYDHNLRDSNGDSMIMIAAGYARTDVFQFLLESLANCPEDALVSPNQHSSHIQAICSPLESISFEVSDERAFKGAEKLDSKSTETKRSLAEEGAIETYLCYITANSITGQTAAHLAAEKNMHTNFAQIIKKAPACMNALDNDTSTPAHIAAKLTHKKILQLLIEHSANFSIKDRSGEFPDQLLSSSLNLRYIKRKMTAKRIQNCKKRERTEQVVCSSVTSHASDYIPLYTSPLPLPAPHFDKCPTTDTTECPSSMRKYQPSTSKLQRRTG